MSGQKKVAMLLDNPFVNDARVYKEAKSLVDNGFEVTIYCQESQDVPEEEKKDGILIKRVFPFYLGTTLLIDKYLRSHLSLFGAVKNQYDIFHCHDTETWPIGYILAKDMGAKFICDSHEYFPDYICREWHSDPFKHELTRNLVKARGEYIREADAVIVVSEEIAAALHKEYSLSRRPTVIYNTRPYSDVPAGKNLVREKYKIDDSTRIILFQGTIEPSRGVDIAIRTLPYVRDSVLVILGDGRREYLDELRLMANDLGIGQRVIFAGPVPHEELLLYSGFGDVLVYFGRPLLTNLEYSMPNKFFDYIFAERPMVIGDLISMKKMVETCGLGAVVNIHDIDYKEIGDTVNRLLDNKTLQQKYIANIRRCKPLLSWEEQEQKLLKLYETL